MSVKVVVKVKVRWVSTVDLHDGVDGWRKCRNSGREEEGETSAGEKEMVIVETYYLEHKYNNRLFE